MHGPFKELDSVRVLHVSADPLHHLLWELSVRGPQVGDIGAVIEVRPNTALSALYAVECVSASGQTLWIAHFDATEIGLVSRPE
jgi:hypothetical protein